MEKPEYISKSQIKLWIKCRKKYFYNYIKRIETEETESMVRGTDIHNIIENFYNNAEEYARTNDIPPTTMISLIDDDVVDNWRDYLDPYISNFLAFERKRLTYCDDMDNWIPASVEERMTRQVYDDAPELVGYADVILPSSSFPNAVDVEDGNILVDFKTGGVPDESYRDYKKGGIMLDLVFYQVLFEHKYDIQAVGGYYPKSDTFIVEKVTDSQREYIYDKIKEIANSNPQLENNYPVDTSPLCAWGSEDGERCEYYEQCPSTWGIPIDNQDEIVSHLRNGLSNEEIANKMGTSTDAINYWIHKNDWYRFRDK